MVARWRYNLIHFKSHGTTDFNHRQELLSLCMHCSVPTVCTCWPYKARYPWLLPGAYSAKGFLVQVAVEGLHECSIWLNLNYKDGPTCVAPSLVGEVHLNECVHLCIWEGMSCSQEYPFMNGPVLGMRLGLPSKAVMKLCALKMRQTC